MLWERDGTAFYAMAQDRTGEVRSYLIVERLPDTGWDWAVWPSRRDSPLNRAGSANTVHDAMRAAEAAEQALNGLEGFS